MFINYVAHLGPTVIKLIVNVDHSNILIPFLYMPTNGCVVLQNYISAPQNGACTDHCITLQMC
jgi:hypothetical protein